ncbi:MAG TPA: HIT family protein [Methylophilaceae bacterium]|jgi:diadenosine tetraphosphate (Ap4A) HIT family hydrolase
MAICELCKTAGGELLWQDEFCRVVSVNDHDYPGFCRVILNSHTKEMSDLTLEEQGRLMTVVFLVEQVIRDVMNPDKINLASLGNKTPHMHWHIIPRYQKDKHFPNPIWGTSMRENYPHTLDTITALKLKNQVQKVLG